MRQHLPEDSKTTSVKFTAVISKLKAPQSYEKK
jgi:hypothetical protein